MIINEAAAHVDAVTEAARAVAAAAAASPRQYTPAELHRALAEAAAAQLLAELVRPRTREERAAAANAAARAEMRRMGAYTSKPEEELSDEQKEARRRANDAAHEARERGEMAKAAMRESAWHTDEEKSEFGEAADGLAEAAADGVQGCALWLAEAGLASDVDYTLADLHDALADAIGEPEELEESGLRDAIDAARLAGNALGGLRRQRRESRLQRKRREESEAHALRMRKAAAEAETAAHLRAENERLRREIAACHAHCKAHGVPIPGAAT